MSVFKIVIIGSGNVAYQLAWHLHNSGHEIIQIVSRHLDAAKWIGNLMEVPSTNRYSEVSLLADIYLLTVKDDAIDEVANQLNLADKVIAHTSGSVGLNALQKASKNYGVFYPLQTLSRNVSVDFSHIPICIDASNSHTAIRLKELAATLTNKIIEADDQKRLAIHVAAVFANNFTNHLFSIAQMLLERNGLSFEILKPLIHETVRKIQNHDPLNVQTGPAIRHDEHTIKKHLDFLKDDHQFAEIYSALTEDIQQWKIGNEA
jgi:predicted short-subunit dehydrogenase-like oxidoreductase (DUF2520 family)